MTSSSDIIPYVVGSLITLALIKWLFGKVDNRPVNSPSLYFSYSPDPEALIELQGMFPNIPRPYIIRELDRANGEASVAIDKLLLLAPDFMNGNESQSSLDTSPMARSDSSTQYNIIKTVQSDGNIVAASSSGSVKLTKRNWDSVDSKTRQGILSIKKKEMLMKAREAFLSKESKGEEGDNNM